MESKNDNVTQILRNEIPPDWKILNFRYVLEILTDFTSNGSFSDLADNVEYLEEGFSRLIRLTDLRQNLNNKGLYVSENAHNYLQKTSLQGGEILIANVGAYSGLAWRVPSLSSPSTLGPNMYLLKFKENIDPNFAYYSLLSNYFVQQLKLKSASSAQPKLNKEDVKTCRFVLPPINRQIQIGGFLDNKTEEISKIIKTKEDIINNLKKLKLSLLFELTTKGLNENCSFDESRVDWIGRKPSHWKLIKIKYLFEIKKEIASELGHNVLSVTQKGIKIKDIESAKGQLSLDYSKYQLVSKGDFIMNHMDLQTGFIDISNYEGVTSPDYRVFKRKRNDVLDQFYLYYFQYCYYDKIFFGLGQGVSQLGRWRMPREIFKNFVVVLPPLNEQIEIVKKIQNVESKIETIIKREQQSIKNLKAYNNIIINEVVTGLRKPF